MNESRPNLQRIQVWIAVTGIIAAILIVSVARRWKSDADNRAHTSRLRVLTYNAQFLPGFARLLNTRGDANYRAASLAEKLLEYDIIGLNEVFDSRARDTLIEGLKSACGDAFHFVTPPRDERSALGVGSGLMIISRLPALESHSLRYGNDSNPLTRGLMGDGYVAKGILHARIGKPDSASDDFLDVFVTHLESQVQSIRDAQYVMLGDFVRRYSSPRHSVLVLGDMNTDGRASFSEDSASSYHRLIDALAAVRPDSDMIDVWLEHSAEPGGTSDPDDPAGGERIDYIFVSNPKSRGRALHPTAVHVNPFPDKKVGSLSDHSAVEADLSWALAP